MGRTRTIHELGFAPSDQQRISGAMRRTTDVCTYRRLQGMLLVARGYSITEVTRITTAKSAALYDWVRRYLRTHKPESLHNAARSGRPPTAVAITSARIVCEFRRDPLALGYSTTGWTVSLLAAHLSRKYDCPLSTRTLRRRMRAVGLRWKRPRYVYADMAGGLFESFAAKSRTTGRQRILFEDVVQRVDLPIQTTHKPLFGLLYLELRIADLLQPRDSGMNGSTTPARRSARSGRFAGKPRFTEILPETACHSRVPRDNRIAIEPTNQDQVHESDCVRGRPARQHCRSSGHEAGGKG